MTLQSLIEEGVDFYSDHGAIRTIGAVSGFCGSKVAQRCSQLDEMLEQDRAKGYPLRVRLQAARHGISAHEYLWMGLEDANLDRYLTTVDPIRDLNRGHITPIHNKYTFQLMTEPYVGSLPALYGRLDGGEFTTPLKSQEEELFAVLNRAGAVALKPVTGAKGSGIYVLRQTDEFLVNGHPSDKGTIANLVAGLDGYVVTEFVQQHSYAESIFPDATNTLRVFSIIDPDTGKPRVLRAAHRFGSTESEPTDNLSQGGYCAHVDVSTGKIEQVLVLEDAARSKLNGHPETGREVCGVEVPYWDEVRELVREVATVHRQAPLVGWDIVVSEDGPVLIEGNARPGRVLLQLERGILEDRRVRRLLGTDNEPA